MNIRNCINKFITLGIVSWEHIGWRTGRSVHRSQVGEDTITISIHISETMEVGLLISSCAVEPEHCFTTTLSGIEEWFNIYTNVMEKE